MSIRKLCLANEFRNVRDETQNQTLQNTAAVKERLAISLERQSMKHCVSNIFTRSPPLIGKALRAVSKRRDIFLHIQANIHALI
jgi:hypothetical protein